MEVSTTLFSLEVAVECVRLQSSTVPCRFPAVAFRLLDFPTLIVHHIDPGNASHIKNSVFIDEELNGIPLQLQELKNHRGNFVFKKGKSCMFKMNIETLRAHLSNTPLYVMLVDTWPDVPRLVANCTVSLKELIENVCKDVQTSGIEVPTVQCVRDSYKLCNLMGSEIGWGVLGVRLLSLGSSIMAHIPQTALVSRRSVENQWENNDINKDLTPKKARQDLDTAAEAEVPKQKLTFAISTAEIVKQKEHRPLKSSGTQTLKSREKLHVPHKHFPSGFSIPGTVKTQHINLIASNTHCPPPLYFNAKFLNGDDHGHQNNHKTAPHKDYTEENINSSVVSSITSSEAMSIDSQKQYTETHYKYQSVASGERKTTSASVRKTHRKKTSRPTCNHQVGTLLRAHRLPEEDSSIQIENVISTFNLGNHSQLPILTALLRELSLLQCNNLAAGTSVQDPPQFHEKPKPSKQEINLPSGKENKQEQNMVPEKNTYQHKHADCTKTLRAVPAAKGWLRKEPTFSKKSKTKLVYGMTNTQKLRLQRNNPELLKRMEKQESRIRSHRQSLADEVRKKKEKAKLEINHTCDVDISTDISHHSVHHVNKLGGVDKLGMQIANNPLRIDLHDFSDAHEHTQSDINRRNPVPTPCTMKDATCKWNDVDGLQQTVGLDKSDQESAHAVITNDYEEDKDYGHIKDVHGYSSSEKGSKSGHNIDVYLPTPTIEEPFKEDENLQTSLQGTPRKTVTIPGFPSTASTPHDEDYLEQNSLKYSDDFDSSKNFESTGEQDLHHLSKSNSERSASVHLDSSGEESHSNHSLTAYQSKPSNASHDNQQGITSNRQVTSFKELHSARLHAGFALTKPLLSTKSPVPLDMRRSSRPSLKIQSPVDSTEEEDIKVTPPTPKPRLNLQQSGSPLLTASQLPENISSDLSTNDSEKQYIYDSIYQTSKKELSDEAYSENFNSSDSN